MLGEAYAAILLGKSVQATVGAKRYETPYINPNDSRMTPNTFEALVVQGGIGGSRGTPAWHFGAGYFDKIKERGSDESISMATGAGAPSGVARGVAFAGTHYSHGDLSIGGIDYYSEDIINIAYLEAKEVVTLRERLRLHVAGQYANQRNIGGDLLTGHPFSANQEGIKIELSYDGVLITTAYTHTNKGSTMHSRWGGYPGYTSVQIENFDRGGEDAWMLRAAYNFRFVKNLSAYALYVHGSTPDIPKQFAQDEYDLNFQWKAAAGPLKGLPYARGLGMCVKQAWGNRKPIRYA